MYSMSGQTNSFGSVYTTANTRSFEDGIKQLDDLILFFENERAREVYFRLSVDELWCWKSVES